MERPQVKKAIDFIRQNRWLIVVLLLMVFEHFLFIHRSGVEYNLGSDDLGYFNAGITLLKTGRITLYENMPSAQAMPGMAVIIAAMAFFFGTGHALWRGLKMLWLVFAVITVIYIYKATEKITGRKSAAIFAVLPMLAINIIWMDNLVLTETPYMMCFAACIYYSLEMAEKDTLKPAVWYTLFWVAGFMFRANLAILLVVNMLYVFARKRNIKLMAKRLLIILLSLAVILVPWVIRNDRIFGRPTVTYGLGNGMLLGTYQGEGYPSDKECDYANNVDRPYREEYAEYLDEDGKEKDELHHRFLKQERQMIKAQYRKTVWKEKNPASYWKSQLLLKPWMMINSVFYWDKVFNISKSQVLAVRNINLIICCLGIALSCFVKKHRLELWACAGSYLAFIYIYAVAYAFERYAETLMPFRYILAGISFALAAEIIESYKNKKVKEKEKCQEKSRELQL